MNRRGFLRMLGLGAAAAAAPAALLEEPRRRIWAVPSTAPVGSRIERAGLEGFPGMAAWLPDGNDAADAALYAFGAGRRGGKSIAARVQQIADFRDTGLIDAELARELLNAPPIVGKGIVEELRELQLELDEAIFRVAQDMTPTLFKVEAASMADDLKIVGVYTVTGIDHAVARRRGTP